MSPFNRKLLPDTTRTRVVTSSMLASKQTTLAPALLATSSLIELMELATGEALEPFIALGETSVVAQISMTHSAPVQEGVSVAVTAYHTRTEGVRQSFRVVATDPGGLVAEAEVSRVIINDALIMLRAKVRQVVPLFDRFAAVPGPGEDVLDLCMKPPLGQRGLKDEDCFHGFHDAVQSGNIESIKGWLASGEDLSPLLDGALYVAVIEGRAEVVTLLLEQGANPKRLVDTSQRETLLHLAAKHGSMDVIPILCRSGLDPNAGAYIEQLSPIHCAINNLVGEGHDRTVKALLDSGANPNCTDDENWTCLRYAANIGDDCLAELLLDYKADLTDTTMKGDTPLQLAVRQGRKMVVSVLLRRGADPGLKDARCNAWEWLEGRDSGLYSVGRCLRP
ncbi:ankyrin repeat-containing domain protein [Aspergillus cavernicola]|uniref:Ankyrin repeat-containing domain protein n=1 Tax=Aspergillus cavernicola TaxID=176166 RepID=A0ABR4J2P9_9EURO